jgi:hypothetical protein
MKKLLFVPFVSIVWLYGCKKSCLTCVNQTGDTLYDSTTMVSYDSTHHRNDTVLIKIDTFSYASPLSIIHFCPGSQTYSDIVNGTGVPLSYYNPANYQTYYCGYDQ